MPEFFSSSLAVDGRATQRDGTGKGRFHQKRDEGRDARRVTSGGDPADADAPLPGGGIGRRSLRRGGLGLGRLGDGRVGCGCHGNGNPERVGGRGDAVLSGHPERPGAAAIGGDGRGDGRVGVGRGNRDVRGSGQRGARRELDGKPVVRQRRRRSRNGHALDARVGVERRNKRRTTG